MQQNLHFPYSVEVPGASHQPEVMEKKIYLSKMLKRLPYHSICSHDCFTVQSCACNRIKNCVRLLIACTCLMAYNQCFYALSLIHAEIPEKIRHQKDLLGQMHPILRKARAVRSRLMVPILVGRQSSCWSVQ